MNKKCECGCGCLAAATDASGVFCEACSEYVIVGSAVICSQAELEALPDGWRLPPPPPPVTDPHGKWALWWETLPPADSRLLARYATREDAQQALRSLDWPRPGDLCGYGIRYWDPEEESWRRYGIEGPNPRPKEES